MRFLSVLVVVAGCYGFVGLDEEQNANDRDGDGVVHGEDCDDADSYAGEKQTWYPDADGDGYGDMAADGIDSCDDPDGYSLDHTDCNDGDPAIAPNVDEACNDIDDDCNGAVDEVAECEDHNTDSDGDGFAADVDCDDADADVFPNAEEIPYDGIDQDCDDADLTDVDEDGYDAIEAGGNDCDDEDDAVNPGMTETCNDIDDDCS